MHRNPHVIFLFLLFSLIGYNISVSAQTVSERIKQSYTTLHPHIIINDIEDITNGNFIEPYSQKIMTGLPPFRRISLISRPTSESNIGIEVWMPIENWNGRFLGTGTGGGAGYINFWALEIGLKRGFAVANTDMGTSPAAHEVYEYPERWKDFGYRATHEMTVVAKKFIKKYYGKEPLYSYFQGCSTGGQQALSEAQRYPDDYNGILAGAPANNRTHLHTMFLWCHALCNENPELMFSKKQLQKITEIVIQKNVGKDGGAPTDHFLTDPRTAVIDTEIFKSFLSEKQINILKKILNGPINPNTGERIYCSFPLNSEDKPSGQEYFQGKSAVNELLYPFIWAFGKDFDYRKFDFDKDLEKVDSILAPVLNANNPDLRPLKKNNGKIIMYTGTCDPIVPFPDAINYYERVIEQMGSLEETQTFFRYFIIPGMNHCSNGPGVNDFGQGFPTPPNPDKEQDILTLLMDWVERGNAPERIIATRYKDNSRKEIEMQRPVYPYPDFPHYIGGDPALPQNYKRETHPRNNVPISAKKYLK